MGLFNRRKKRAERSRYTCSDEEFIYGKEGDSYPIPLKLAYAQERGQVFKESTDLMSQTLSLTTFIYRYNVAIREAKTIIRLSKGYPTEKETMDALDVLYDDKVDLFNGFFYRCYTAGRLPFIKGDIIEHQSEIPEESYAFYECLLEEMVDEQDEDEKEYIFCSVVFQSGGKAYYYLSDDKDIRCGDNVIVPVGRNNREEDARVVKVERFKGCKAPLPPGSLKYILEVIT